MNFQGQGGIPVRPEIIRRESALKTDWQVDLSGQFRLSATSGASDVPARSRRAFLPAAFPAVTFFFKKKRTWY